MFNSICSANLKTCKKAQLSTFAVFAINPSNDIKNVLKKQQASKLLIHILTYACCKKCIKVICIFDIAVNKISDKIHFQSKFNINPHAGRDAKRTYFQIDLDL